MSVKNVMTVCLVIIAGVLFSSENLLNKVNFIVKGKTNPDGTYELPISRLRSDYKPQIYDGGFIAHPVMKKGRYKFSVSFKGEKVETTTVWFALDAAGKKLYPAKNFKGTKGKGWQDLVFEFDVPADCKSATFALMFKTSKKNTGVKVIARKPVLIPVKK